MITPKSDSPGSSLYGINPGLKLNQLIRGYSKTASGKAKQLIQSLLLHK